TQEVTTGPGSSFASNPVLTNNAARYIDVRDVTGVAWTVAAPTTTVNFLSATSNGSRIVAVGALGEIWYTDNDGGSWTKATSPVATTLMEVKFSNSQFIIVGNNTGGSGVILTSPDGSTWTRRTTGVPDVVLRSVSTMSSTIVVC